jgi:hypothetical protein
LQGKDESEDGAWSDRSVIFAFESANGGLARGEKNGCIQCNKVFPIEFAFPKTAAITPAYAERPRGRTSRGFA